MVSSSTARSTRTRGEGGFTLSELLLVTVVVVALVLVAVLSVRGIDRDNAPSYCQTDLRSLKLAVERYEANTGGYPDSHADLAGAGLVGTETGLWTFTSNGPDEAPDYQTTDPGRC